MDFRQPVFSGVLQITVLGFRTEVMRSYVPSLDPISRPFPDELISYKKRSGGKLAVYAKRAMFNNIESNRNFDGVATYGKRFFDDFKHADYDNEYLI